jgi:hypothetical protein
VEAEITKLLVRARAVLAGFDGPRTDSRLTGTLRPSELLAIARPVFYELGVASAAEGPVGRITLRFEAPSSSPRAFKLALYADAGKLVLTTRWIPYDERPLAMRGPPSAEGWDEDGFEAPILAHVNEGLAAFEDDLAQGRGHLDSSGDLLGLSD